MALPLLVPLRAVESDRVHYQTHPHRRRRITIDHAPLSGVEPAEVLDWFRNLDGYLEYGGRIVPRYLAWHPIDHVRWELARPAPAGGAGEGAQFHIVERFGGRPENEVDVIDTVEKLDETGIRLVQRVAGVVVLQLEHTWSTGRDGTHYVSVLDLGARTRVFTPVNRLLQRQFPDRLVHAWVRHNIEEVGQLEYLLPRLTAATTASSPDGPAVGSQS